MASFQVTIRLERVTETRTGIWCDRCLLPSITECEMAALHGDHILNIGAYRRCRSGCDDGSVTAEGQAP